MLQNLCYEKTVACVSMMATIYASSIASLHSIRSYIGRALTPICLHDKQTIFDNEPDNAQQTTKKVGKIMHGYRAIFLMQYLLGPTIYRGSKKNNCICISL